MTPEALKLARALEDAGLIFVSDHSSEIEAFPSLIDGTPLTPYLEKAVAALSTAHTATAGDGGERTWHRDGALLYTLKPHVNQFGRSRGKMVNDVTVRVEGPDADTIATEIHAALAQAPAVQAPAGEDITSPEFWKHRQAEWLQQRDAEHDAAWIDRLRRHFLAAPTPTDAQPKDASPVGDEALREALTLVGKYLGTVRECFKSGPGSWHLMRAQSVVAAALVSHPTTGQETVATPRDGGVREALEEAIGRVRLPDEPERTIKWRYPYHVRRDLAAVALAALSAPGSAGPEETSVRSQAKWKCRKCGAETDQPDSALIKHPAGYGYKAPCCGPCGHYFSADDIEAATPSPAQEPGTEDTGEAGRPIEEAPPATAYRRC